MESTVISTRADLDMVIGTPAHAAFMAMLAGSLYRLEKDDLAKKWVAVEDTTTIQRFGFARADFSAVAPVLPDYVPPPSKVPQSVTMAQAQLALLATGKLDAVEAAVATMPREAQILWSKANTVVRGDPLVIALAARLGLTDADVDALFVAAAAL